MPDFLCAASATTQRLSHPGPPGARGPAGAPHHRTRAAGATGARPSPGPGQAAPLRRAPYFCAGPRPASPATQPGASRRVRTARAAAHAPRRPRLPRLARPRSFGEQSFGQRASISSPAEGRIRDVEEVAAVNQAPAGRGRAAGAAGAAVGAASGSPAPPPPAPSSGAARLPLAGGGAGSPRGRRPPGAGALRPRPRSPRGRRGRCGHPHGAHERGTPGSDDRAPPAERDPTASAARGTPGRPNPPWLSRPEPAGHRASGCASFQSATERGRDLPHPGLLRGSSQAGKTGRASGLREPGSMANASGKPASAQGGEETGRRKQETSLKAKKVHASPPHLLPGADRKESQQLRAGPRNQVMGAGGGGVRR